LPPPDLRVSVDRCGSESHLEQRVDERIMSAYPHLTIDLRQRGRSAAHGAHRLI
jgi:oleate hydratase